MDGPPGSLTWQQPLPLPPLQPGLGFLNQSPTFLYFKVIMQVIKGFSIVNDVPGTT